LWKFKPEIHISSASILVRQKLPLPILSNELGSWFHESSVVSMCRQLLFHAALWHNPVIFLRHCCRLQSLLFLTEGLVRGSSKPSLQFLKALIKLLWPLPSCVLPSESCQWSCYCWKPFDKPPIISFQFKKTTDFSYRSRPG